MSLKARIGTAFESGPRRLWTAGMIRVYLRFTALPHEIEKALDDSGFTFETVAGHRVYLIQTLKRTRKSR